MNLDKYNDTYDCNSVDDVTNLFNKITKETKIKRDDIAEYCYIFKNI